MANNYHYSGQIRKFIQQFIRLMSNFQVELGKDRNGTTSLLQVPVFYGDASRQASQILRGNSENTLNSVPAMAVYISALQYDRARVQEPYHVSTMHLRERARDPVTGNLTSEQGDLISVERLMPVPYKITFKCDIWASNTDQKLQLLEQIAVLFNPALEIQSTDNYIDWTSLSYVTLTDTSFTSRTVPSGLEDPIDISSMTFEVPIWISAPAKIKKMGVIQRIIASIYAEDGTISDEVFAPDVSALISRRVYTPLDHNIIYLGNTLKLILSSNQINFDGTTTLNAEVSASWSETILRYGELRNGTSQVRLEQDGGTVLGTVAYHPTDDSLLMFTPVIDTLPANTLDPVTAIINPYTVAVDSALLSPVTGTRFLILNPIGASDNADDSSIWDTVGYPALVANENDIIEYNGTHWVVSFDSLSVDTTQYLTNLRTVTQYKWKDSQWTRSVEGRYGVGSWSFVL